jgi:spore coat protein U-like protein
MKRIVAIFVVLGGLLAAAQIMAAGPNSIDVSATVLSKNNCKFNTAASALNFGDLDPANPVDVTVSTAVTFVCRGSAPVATFFIDDDDGLNETGPDGNRMAHATLPATYLPYSLSLNPTSATVPKNAAQTLTINGTVLGNDYQSAFVGSYSDTVVISITP